MQHLQFLTESVRRIIGSDSNLITKCYAEVGCSMAAPRLKIVDSSENNEGKRQRKG